MLAMPPVRLESCSRYVLLLSALAQAAVLFVVNRGDCHSVSVRRSSCAALAAAAARAAAGGVAFHAFRVRWSGSQAHFDGAVPTDV